MWGGGGGNRQKNVLLVRSLQSEVLQKFLASFFSMICIVALQFHKVTSLGNMRLYSAT